MVFLIFRRRACFTWIGARKSLAALTATALLSGPALAQGESGLPEPVSAVLRQARIPLSATAWVVAPLDGPGLSVNVNEHQAMNPASTMKLVTTYVALNVLGPTYSWRTEAFVQGALRGDVLDGDLVIRGSGDPKLVIENLWLLVSRIRSFGIRELRGHVVLDRSAFESIAHDPAEFDGDAFRPYNAGPDALLLNFKAISIGFVPEPDTGSARVFAVPALAGMTLPASVPLSASGGCGDWRSRLKPDFTKPMAPVFRGSYPNACGERIWHLSLLGHAQYFGAAFRALWESAGGRWSGSVRDGVAGAEARRIAVHESPPLSDVIRDINKFSNNVMARQLYLTLGAAHARSTANQERAEAALRSWLAPRGLAAPELVLENGAGLSRNERISAGALARLLQHAWSSPLMPEFVSSLPIAGVDGTMRTRSAATGYAHIKTGLLADVRASAGYVLAASGRRYVVVAIVNHPLATASLPAHEALLQWVHERG